MGGDSGHRSETNHQEGSGAWDYSAKSVRTGLGISCPLGYCIAEAPRHPPQSAIKSADASLPCRALSPLGFSCSSGVAACRREKLTRARNPRSRMSGHVVVEDAAASHLHQHEYVQVSKSSCDHDEE